MRLMRETTRELAYCGLMTANVLPRDKCLLRESLGGHSTEIPRVVGCGHDFLLLGCKSFHSEICLSKYSIQDRCNSRAIQFYKLFYLDAPRVHLVCNFPRVYHRVSIKTVSRRCSSNVMLKWLTNYPILAWEEHRFVAASPGYRSWTSLRLPCHWQSG